MAKIFFSYSWAQEELVTSVGNDLGRDFVIQDKFNFESGQKLDEEMKNKIKDSDIFVFFLSMDSIKSINVQLELDFVLPLVASKKIIFCPVYIDNRVIIGEDWERYDWIKTYLLNFNDKKSRIVRLIRQKIRQLIWNKYGIKNRFFKGREKDKFEITRDFFYDVNSYKRAVFVSGVPYIGRKSLLLETIINNLDTTLSSDYEPITISLNETDSIDSLILQLGEYSSIDEIDKRLNEGKYIELIIDLLNDLQKDNQKTIIDDKQCIVLRNGQIVDWFLDLIQNPKLANYTHFYVASENTVSPSVEKQYKQIQAHRIYPLSKDDMRTIFAAYARLKNVSCSSQETETYINRFNGYPQPIINVVDDIAKSGNILAMRWLDNNLKLYDSSNRELLDYIKEDHDLYSLTFLLSKVEYISYDILCELLPNIDIANKLEKLFYLSLTEHFGNQYYRLSRSLSDYINRSNITDYEIEEKIRNLGARSLESIESDYIDLSEKLISIKERIKESPRNVSIDLLLPSYSLKVIMDLYYKKDYRNVQILALRLLNDSQRNIYNSVMRSVKYWLCLAASRNKEKKVFDNHVMFFNNENKKLNATYFFLNGFYARCQANYETAQRWYEKAIECQDYYEVKKHLAKVKHELALVYVKLDNPKALELARENYKKGNDNVYHIETYYRCLVRSNNPDIDELKELYNKMEQSYDTYKDVILETFSAEYLYYIDHDILKSIKKLKQIIIDYPNTIQYPIDALEHIKKLENKKGNKTNEIDQTLNKHETEKSIYRFDNY